MTIKVVINPALCEENGICARLAPEVFSSSPYGDVIMEHTPDELRLKIALAVKQCPASAITATPE